MKFSLSVSHFPKTRRRKSDTSNSQHTQDLVCVENLKYLRGFLGAMF